MVALFLAQHTNKQTAYLSEAHVLLNGVHPVPELCPGGVHVADHGADVPDDGGEDEHAHKEVDRHEQVFDVLEESDLLILIEDTTFLDVDNTQKWSGIETIVRYIYF